MLAHYVIISELKQIMCMNLYMMIVQGAMMFKVLLA